MTGLFVLLGGITLCVGVVTLLDGIAYRRNRKTGVNNLP
jgi:hypothetical protein